MDEAVLRAQKWVNKTYLKPNGYSLIAEDGLTGKNTVKALIIALQIEIGIAGPNGTFGPATKNACPTLAKNPDSEPQNIIRILQHGLFCKGYSTKSVTGIFGDNTEAAIKRIQADAGLEQDGIVTPMIFKAILSTDSLLLDAFGDPEIRYIQQQLNNRYSSYFDIISCNGVYERNTNKALIYALQAEEGMKPNEANGVFGPATQKKCPVITIENAEKNKAYIKILKYALKCNGMIIDSYDNSIDEQTLSSIVDFRCFMALPESNYDIDLDLWMSLLLSKGNPERKCIGCDCATAINRDNIDVLTKNGYKVIGRYLIGLYKMNRQELQLLHERDISVFPIFQRSGEGKSSNKVSYFTLEQALIDADAAIDSALKLGFMTGTIIFFTVDYDAYDQQVTSKIIPYFRRIRDRFKEKNYIGYKIGVYGPRNVCSRLSKEGCTVASFVSDMSTGYSGNLGYTMPNDWLYDQIKTVVISDDSTGRVIEIDKDVVRYYSECNSYYDDGVTLRESFKRALALTSKFEGGDAGYKAISGNSDGMGLSLGIIQFNIGSGTLQPLIKTMIESYYSVVKRIFGEDKTMDLERMLEDERGIDGQLIWARGINDKNNNIVDEWKTPFESLCDTTEFQGIQNDYMQEYILHAIKKCHLFREKKDLCTVRSFAFMFDLSVHCGFFSTDETTLIMDSIRPDMYEKEVLLIIADIFKSTRGEDTYDRLNCIADGVGYVHGVLFDISEFGIDDRIINNFPPDSELENNLIFN